MTGKALRHGNLPETTVFVETDTTKRADSTSKETVHIRHVLLGILPYVKVTKRKSGCKFGEK